MFLGWGNDAKDTRWGCLKRRGLTPSMRRKGDRLDNAPTAGFFASINSERVHRARFATRRAAEQALFRPIERSCQRRRRHSALAWMTPAQASQRMTTAA
jgi:transposase InsO family protein